ncbi:MAG: FGGY-family carbohydrate kinase [Treponema sp.]|jgi:xylulokinase|nr:FGGY-family carbohydrate kinase [Treponema sp.]
MTVSSVILCADIGTSSLKAALIDLEGREWAFAREVYHRRRFAQKHIRASDWEAALSLAVRRLFAAWKGPRPSAACISGNGPTLVPVALNGEALPPLHWYDRKFVPVDPGPGGMLAALDAPPKAESFFLPYAGWFLQHRPEEYDKTQYLFSAQEWLSFRLGAEPVTALPAAAYIPYYWEEDQCAALGFDIRKFPPFVPLGSIIGTVSPKAADHFGLPAGIPIVAGGPDFIMALLGVGAVEPGMVCNRAGTSEGINVCSAAPIQSRNLRVLPHLEAGLWNIGGVISSSGRLFEWYRSLTGQETRSYEETLEELIAPDSILPQDKALFFPQSGFHEPDQPDMLFGRGPMSRVGLGRAVLEALGFMARGVLDALHGHGFPVTEMRVSGGQGRNPLWNQLKADITGCTLLIPEMSDGELAGDAALAAIALKEISGVAEAVRRMIRIKHRYTPDAQRHARYREQYDAYCTYREGLERFWKRENPQGVFYKTTM